MDREEHGGCLIQRNSWYECRNQIATERNKMMTCLEREEEE